MRKKLEVGQCFGRPDDRIKNRFYVSRLFLGAKQCGTDVLIQKLSYELLVPSPVAMQISA